MGLSQSIISYIDRMLIRILGEKEVLKMLGETDFFFVGLLGPSINMLMLVVKS